MWVAGFSTISLRVYCQSYGETARHPSFFFRVLPPKKNEPTTTKNDLPTSPRGFGDLHRRAATKPSRPGAGPANCLFSTASCPFPLCTRSLCNSTLRTRSLCNSTLRPFCARSATRYMHNLIARPSCALFPRSATRCTRTCSLDFMHTARFRSGERARFPTVSSSCCPGI